MSDNKNSNIEDKGTLDINSDVVSHADKILSEEKQKPKAKVKRKRRSAKSYLSEPKTNKTTISQAMAKKRSGAKKATKKTVKKAVKKVVKKAVKKVVKKAVKKTAPKVVRRKTTPKKDTSFVFVDADQLPTHYGTTEVVLSARDPYCMFAYWFIDPKDTERLEKELGDRMHGAVYTFRLFDVSCIDFNGFNSNGWTDYDELFMNNRYINDCRDNTSYLAEIGIRTTDGGFYPLARSNSVLTPRANISDRCDLIWQEVKENADPKIYIKVDVQSFKGKKKLFPRNNWQNYVKKVSLSYEDILSYYARSQMLSRYLQAKYFADQQGAKGAFLSTEKSFNAALIKRYGTQTEYIGASDYSAISGDGFDTFAREHRVEDDFNFEIDTELIVRGKAEPGSIVYIGDKKVDVNADGTFMLHYHLPEGHIPLDLTAQSPRSAQKKQIITSVQRSKTNYRKFS